MSDTSSNIFDTVNIATEWVSRLLSAFGAVVRSVSVWVVGGLTLAFALILLTIWAIHPPLQWRTLIELGLGLSIAWTVGLYGFAMIGLAGGLVNALVSLRLSYHLVGLALSGVERVEQLTPDQIRERLEQVIGLESVKVRNSLPRWRLIKRWVIRRAYVVVLAAVMRMPSQSLEAALTGDVQTSVAALIDDTIGSIATAAPIRMGLVLAIGGLLGGVTAAGGVAATISALF